MQTRTGVTEPMKRLNIDTGIVKKDEFTFAKLVVVMSKIECFWVELAEISGVYDGLVEKELL